LRGKLVALLNGNFLGQQLRQALNKEYTTISGTTCVLTINKSDSVSLTTRTAIVLEQWFPWLPTT